MVRIDSEDESGRYENLKEDGKSERYAARVFTTVNASLNLKASAKTSTCSYLF